jgi:hypothetical protein
METQNPKPFKKAHRAVLSSYMHTEANTSRHEVQPGLHAILASPPGSQYPETVAYEFDSAMFKPDQALEWLLANGGHPGLRFERAE